MNDIVHGTLHDIFDLVKRRKMAEARDALKRERELFNLREVSLLRDAVNEIVKSLSLLDRQIIVLTKRHKEICTFCPEDLLGSISEYIEELKREKIKLEVLKRTMVRRR